MPTINLGSISLAETKEHDMTISNDGTDSLYIYSIKGDLLTGITDTTTEEEDIFFPVIIEPDSNLVFRLNFMVNFKQEMPTTIEISTNERNYETTVYDVIATIPDPPGFRVNSNMEFSETEVFTNGYGTNSTITAGEITQIKESSQYGYCYIDAPNHGLNTGDQVTITRTFYYEGTYRITVYNRNEFEIKATFHTIEYSGRWQKIDVVTLSDVSIIGWQKTANAGGTTALYVFWCFAATDIYKNPFNKLGGGVADYFRFITQGDALIRFSSVELPSSGSYDDLSLDGSYLSIATALPSWTQNVTLAENSSRDISNAILVDLGSDWSAAHAAGVVPGSTAADHGTLTDDKRMWNTPNGTEAELEAFGTFNHNLNVEQNLEITNIGEEELEIKSIKDIGHPNREMIIFDYGTILEPINIVTSDTTADIHGGDPNSAVVPLNGYSDSQTIKIKEGITAEFPIILNKNLSSIDISTRLEITHNAPTEWKKNIINVNLSPIFPALKILEVEERDNASFHKIKLGHIHPTEKFKKTITLTNVGSTNLNVTAINVYDSGYSSLDVEYGSPIDSTYLLGTGTYIYSVNSIEEDIITTSQAGTNSVKQLEVILNIDPTEFSTGRNVLDLWVYSNSDPSFISDYPGAHNVKVEFYKARFTPEVANVVNKNYEITVQMDVSTDIDAYGNNLSNDPLSAKFHVVSNRPQISGEYTGDHYFILYYGDGTFSDKTPLSQLSNEQLSTVTEHDYSSVTTGISSMGVSPFAVLYDENDNVVYDGMYHIENTLHLTDNPSQSAITDPSVHIRIMPSKKQGLITDEWVAVAITRRFSANNSLYTSWDRGFKFEWNLGSNASVITGGGDGTEDGYPYVRFNYNTNSALTSPESRSISCKTTYMKNDGSGNFGTSTEITSPIEKIQLVPNLIVDAFGSSDTSGTANPLNPNTNIIPSTINFGSQLTPATIFRETFKVINQTDNSIDYLVYIEQNPISATMQGIDNTSFTLAGSTATGIYNEQIIDFEVLTFDVSNYYYSRDFSNADYGRIRIDSKQLLYSSVALNSAAPPSGYSDTSSQQIKVNSYKPSSNFVSEIDKSYTTITTTRFHNLNTGDVISINDINEAYYNGVYEIQFAVSGTNTFDIEKAFVFDNSSSTAANLYLHTTNVIPVFGTYMSSSLSAIGI